MKVLISNSAGKTFRQGIVHIIIYILIYTMNTSAAYAQTATVASIIPIPATTHKSKEAFTSYIISPDVNFSAYKSAIGNLTMCLVLNPTVQVAYAKRGCLYEALHMSDEALADFNKAIELDDCDYRSRLNRIIILKGKGHTKKAFTEVSYIIKQMPLLSEAYFVRGNIYMDMGLYNNAMEDFNTAISIVPTDTDFVQ